VKIKYKRNNERLKGRSVIILMMGSSELKKRYGGGYLCGIGYGAWNTGNITDATV
jgi:hypothetical protein